VENLLSTLGLTSVFVKNPEFICWFYYKSLKHRRLPC